MYLLSSKFSIFDGLGIQRQLDTHTYVKFNTFCTLRPSNLSLRKSIILQQRLKHMSILVNISFIGCT